MSALRTTTTSPHAEPPLLLRRLAASSFASPDHAPQSPLPPRPPQRHAPFQAPITPTFPLLLPRLHHGISSRNQEYLVDGFYSLFCDASLATNKWLTFGHGQIYSVRCYLPISRFQTAVVAKPLQPFDNFCSRKGCTDTASESCDRRLSQHFSAPRPSIAQQCATRTLDSWHNLLAAAGGGVVAAHGLKQRHSSLVQPPRGEEVEPDAARSPLSTKSDAPIRETKALLPTLHRPLHSTEPLLTPNGWSAAPPRIPSLRRRGPGSVEPRFWRRDCRSGRSASGALRLRQVRRVAANLRGLRGEWEHQVPRLP